jgi:hypothetical protein
LHFFARLYGLSRREAKERVEEVLGVIGLTDRAREQTKNFSGGMQRRLNIGIGLLHKPRLLVLDEPTVGVAPCSRRPASCWPSPPPPSVSPPGGSGVRSRRNAAATIGCEAVPPGALDW